MNKQAVEGGIRMGNLLFLNGICVYADTFEAELNQCVDELEQTLIANDASLADVLSVTVYLRDIHDRERYLNDVWNARFPEPRPARTTIEVGIGKCRVELQVIAALPDA